MNEFWRKRLLEVAVDLVIQTIRPYINVATIDAQYDALLDRMLQAVHVLVGRWPELYLALTALVEKAKEGDDVAQSLVDALNNMLLVSQNPGMQGVSVAAQASPSECADALNTIAVALGAPASCDKPDCPHEGSEVPVDCDKPDCPHGSSTTPEDCCDGSEDCCDGSEDCCDESPAASDCCDDDKCK